MKKFFKSLLAALPFISPGQAVVAQVVVPPRTEKTVVLTFDDAVVSHAAYVAPLLKKYGFGATFFVCEFTGSPDFSDKTKYMTWDQIAELNRMGFEIGNHTQHHVHVNKMSEEKANAELQYIEDKCAELHIPKPLSFAYPGYDTSSRALKVLSQRGYKFARAGWDRLYEPAKDGSLMMPGFTVHTENLDKVKALLESVEPGKIAVLTFHGVPDTAHPWVTTSPEVFEQIMQLLKDGHYRVIAMRDLASSQ